MHELPCLITPIAVSDLESICKSVFGSDMKLICYQQIGGGQFNTCYRVKLQEPNDDVILRIAPPDDKPLFSYERCMMSAEPHIYQMMRNAGIPVPDVIAMDDSRSIINRSFMFVRYIPSIPMNHPSVPEDAKSLLHMELGKYLARMHAIRGIRFGWPQPDGTIRGHESWWRTFETLMEEMCARAIDAEIIGQSDADKIICILRRNHAVFDMITMPKLVHNDIWDPNVLVREVDGQWHIAAIIDADRAMFADADMEFAFWDDSDSAFFEGYGRYPSITPDAVFRRGFYRLYISMFCTWAYRVQIWKPLEYERCFNGMQRHLQELLAFQPV